MSELHLLLNTDVNIPRDNINTEIKSLLVYSPFYTAPVIGIHQQSGLIK